VLIVFTIATQNMLHCSGRHVSFLLAYLKPYLAPEQTATLQNYHGINEPNLFEVQTMNLLNTFVPQIW
jgi:hypothetical protein